MDLKSKIDVFEGFPKEGISFKDINSLLRDPKAFQCTIDALYDVAKALDANVICIPEARGYILGTPLAYKLGTSLVPIRKPGKLPGEVVSESYNLEYGSNTIEIQKTAIKSGDRVIIVDDLLATGGTMHAAVDLVESLNGEIAGLLFLIELTDLGGRDLLSNYYVKTLVQYPV